MRRIFIILLRTMTRGRSHAFPQAAMAGATTKGLLTWFIDRLENQFNSSVGYMPLVSNKMISNHGFHQSGHYKRLAEMWAVLEQTICPPGGQAVSQYIEYCSLG